MSDLGNKKVFAKNLRKYMSINNIDRNKLCEATGFKYTTLTDWYNGVAYPRIDSIEILSNYFGINKSDLIEDNIVNTNIVTTKLDRNVVKVPVLGKIPAGIPFEAIEDTYTVDYEEIPIDWIRGGKKYFALKLFGNSMEPEYKNNDTVIFLKSSIFESGQDCCVKINGFDATFKKVFIKENGLLISPINLDNDSGFLPRLYTDEDIKNLPVEIIGVAKRHIRDL